MAAPRQSLEQLLEITGHLGAALAQRVPSDDPIIMGHIEAAYKIAESLQSKLRRRQYRELDEDEANKEHAE